MNKHGITQLLVSFLNYFRLHTKLLSFFLAGGWHYVEHPLQSRRKCKATEMPERRFSRIPLVGPDEFSNLSFSRIGQCTQLVCRFAQPGCSFCSPKGMVLVIVAPFTIGHEVAPALTSAFGCIQLEIYGSRMEANHEHQTHFVSGRFF
jgi:hypothetical protein